MGRIGNIINRKSKQNATYMLVYQQQFRWMVTAWMHRRTSLGNMLNFRIWRLWENIPMKGIPVRI